ncbi:MAG TPA: LPS export ABC transporter periplasmic protein LptC [Blastocatellia bacterium]|nr:LPS export ABC transporter periplasmic protein LptC [Blastocatellia bacterium]
MIRVKLVSAGRIAALALFITIAAALTVFLVMRSQRVAVEPDGRPKLQGKVVAVFSNTRYAHQVDGRVRFLLTSGSDKSYEDGTHELEQVKLESYGSDGSRRDVVTSDRAKVSDPSNLQKLDVEFISNVVVTTSEGLTIRTSYLHCDQAKNTVDTNEQVDFESNSLVGRSTGMLIEAFDERVHLHKDVDVTLRAEPLNDGSATKRKARADKTRDETPEQRDARKARKRTRKAKRQREAIAKAVLPTDAVNDAKKGGSGSQSKGSKKTTPRAPTRIRSESARLEKKEHRVSFEGNALVTRAKDQMRAQRMTAYFDAGNRIERIEARGASNLKQLDRAEISSPDMDFFFDPSSNQLARAVAAGGAHSRSLGPPPSREAHADNIEATFVDGSEGNVVDTVRALGNAVVQIHALPAQPKATEREIKADVISLQFYPDGRNIRTADANGNAVLTVTPVRADDRADKKTIRSPGMKADFYEDGNRIRHFNAAGGVRVEIEALVADAHPLRVTTSRTATASFLSDSQDIERVTQEGDFKYNEGDRNAVSERAIYDGQKEILNLRGSRPMVWDATSRTQADEIDYDRGKDETHARGDVRTTYYSNKSTNDSTPFQNTKSPVFITAARADARNAEGVAVYTENARGWQDDNFVKADRIELYKEEKRMVAIGNVDSALYQTRSETSSGKRETVPGFAQADSMFYSDEARLVHYEGSVKARQGEDHIEGSKVDVYLMKDSNDVDHLNAEGSVVLTQPGRRGAGDKLVYTASDGRAVLTGKTARVDDVEKGSTMGSQLTFYIRDDRVFVENQQGTGRVRSSHRLKKEN